MKQSAKARDRAREIIRAAQLQTPNPDSAPAIKHVILTSMREEVEADSDLMWHWTSIGINDDVRAVLKGVSDPEASATRARQLEMFPEAVRHLVRGIDRESVYVPSRQAFVELVPDAMTVKEMREAAAYLIGQGKDTIARGKLLKMLAAALEKEKK